MKKIDQFSFEDNRPTDDDIDELFLQLEQFEPPADFVDRVMGSISRLPLPQYIRPHTDEEEQGELTIYHQQRMLS
jgi:hypothetical protein